MASMQEKTPLQPSARSPRYGSDRGRSPLRSFAAGVGLVATFVAGAWLSISLMGPGRQPAPAAPATSSADGTARAGTGVNGPTPAETGTQEPAPAGMPAAGTAPIDGVVAVPPVEATMAEEETADPPGIASVLSMPEPPSPTPTTPLPAAPPILAPALVPLDTALPRQDEEPAAGTRPVPAADTATHGTAGTDPAPPMPVEAAGEKAAETAMRTAAETASAPEDAALAPTDPPPTDPPAADLPRTEPEDAGSAPAPALAMRPPEPEPSKSNPAAPDPATPDPGVSGPASRGPYTIQVGTFSVPGNADRLVERLERQGFDAYAIDWTDGNGRRWRAVRVGSMRSASEARRIAAVVGARSGEPASVIRLR